MAGFDDKRVMREYDAALDQALMELLAALPPDDFADFSDWLWQAITQEPPLSRSPQTPNYDWAQFGPAIYSTRQQAT